MGGTVKKILVAALPSLIRVRMRPSSRSSARRTEAAEAKAAAADARARDQQQRLQQGRAATIFTSGEGDTNIKTKKPTLGSGM